MNACLIVFYSLSKEVPILVLVYFLVLLTTSFHSPPYSATTAVFDSVFQISILWSAPVNSTSFSLSLASILQLLDFLWWFVLSAIWCNSLVLSAAPELRHNPYPASFFQAQPILFRLFHAELFWFFLWVPIRSELRGLHRRRFSWPPCVALLVCVPHSSSCLSEGLPVDQADRLQPLPYSLMALHSYSSRGYSP